MFPWQCHIIRPDDIEDLREKLKCRTGLVVVGDADDLLRVSKHKKKAEQITQGMVDRCIIVSEERERYFKPGR